MKTNDNFGFMNMPAFEELRKLQEQFSNSALVASMREMQRALDAISIPTPGITAAVQAYRDSIAPLEETWHKINNLYAPILKQSKVLEPLYNSSMIAALQENTSLTKMLAELDFSAIQGFADSFCQRDLQLDDFWNSIDANTVAELYDNGTISNEDVAEELKEIVRKKDFSIGESWDNIKKSKWFLAIRIIFVLFAFLANPVIDKAKENALEYLGVNEFWEESGIYEWLDNIFGIENDGTVTEQEAKETVNRNNIGNVSKKKRDDLVAKIEEIRNFIAAVPQDENTGNLLSYLSELEKDVNGKKYGLVFEEHREEIDEVLDTHTPVLTEEAHLFIDNGGQMNFLIEGDNLASLNLLEKTHKGKIDLIYIDPPYNTGSKNFIYGDSYVDKTDSFLHSKWLSFMRPRLKLAKTLLSTDGVIFISIDDREGAPLLVLCDEIFGEDCFVSNISWQRTYSTRNDSKGIVNEVEHILVYSKQPNWQPNKLPRTAEMNGKYKNPDNDFAPWRSDNAYAPGAATHQGMVYAIQHPFTGKLLYPSASSCWRYQQDQMLEIMSGWCPYELKDLNDAKKRAAVCGVPEEEVRQGVKAIVLSQSLEESAKLAQAVYDKGPWPRFFFSKGGQGGIARKTYLDNVGGKLPTNYWPFSEVGHTDEAKKELKAIFDGDVPFDTPKPVRLIERILQIASSDSSIILDFFAGSATTGHAVMKYNEEHENSNRHFILCTDNENNICRGVAYERIKRVIGKESYATSLKYYKVDYVPISDRMYYEYADELLLHIRELVELENGVNFTGNAEIAIVLTDDELENFIAGLGATSSCRSLYLGHDVLMDAAQAQAIKDYKISIHIIPDYYYKELEG